MRGLLALAGMVALTALALLAPPVIPALVAASALVALRKGRVAFAGFALVACAVNVAIVSLTVPGTPLVHALPFSREGAAAGALAALRLVAATGANLAILSRVPPARLLDDLPLPARVRAYAGAVLIAAHDVQRDFVRLVAARRLRGEWPRGRLARAREAARLLPLLLVSAHERGLARRDALRLAGVDMGARFAPIVAVAALAAAGRLAFLAVPNVALTFVVVFLGGVLFGPLVGAMGALVGMALTDFLLTGLYPAGFVNAPAMAVLGLVGGLLRRVDFRRAEGAMMAACIGIAGTMLFSVVVDSFTWLLVLRDQPAAWRGLVAAGLVFNAVPALVHGALFALATGPTVAAWRARAGARETRVVAPPREGAVDASP